MEGMNAIHPLRPTRVVPAAPEGVAEASLLLSAGEIVGMPTETVYGLAGDAFDEGALRRIFEAKGRPTHDPLILHVVLPAAGGGASAWLVELGIVDGTRLSEAARTTVDRLAASFWPGPLTLVLPRGERVPHLATSGLDTVAVRAPAHPVAQAVLKAVDVPLAAPSANRFGRISPTTAEHVLEELDGRIPLILDGGPSEVGVESTVVQVTPDGGIECLRPGGVPMEALLTVCPLDPGTVRADAPGERQRAPAGNVGAPLPSPGMLESHYAPACPVVLLPAPVRDLEPEALRAHLVARVTPTLSSFSVESGLGVGILLQGGQGWGEAHSALKAALADLMGVRLPGHEPMPVVAHAVLAPGGEAEIAARSLFGALRRLDQHPAVGWIVAEPAPDEAGLRAAINDRLRRAAAPRPRLADPLPGAPPSRTGSTPG
jgi:L-threonylcarbamoyladenylate synthase